MGSKVWPALDAVAWGRTKHSFHSYLQMLGKMRVTLSPAQPNWMFAALHLSARGVTTGPMPYDGTSVEASLDVFSSELIVDHSNGESRRIALLPVRTVAEIYAELRVALEALDVACEISPMPQEVADTTPLSEDRAVGVYEPETVQLWFSAATAAVGVFDRWRAHFFGRTEIAVWWGALDVALLLFSGKHVAPPTDRGYIMKYDLDAELMNVGLYFGDQTTAPFFYGYIYPQPPAAEALAIEPAAASWSTTIGEWVLPYDAIRTSARPTADLSLFLDAIYGHCAQVGGWNREAFSYVPPPSKLRG